MSTEVILPRVDMDMATGKISKWFVEDGATVEKGQPIFEIETDKAAMEVEAPASGQIRDLLNVLDTEMPVGVVIARIFAPGEAYEAPAVAAPTAEPVPEAVAPSPAPVVQAVEPAPAAASAFAEGRPRATPLARQLARQHGIDLANLPGSGPRGRVTSADVRQAAAVTPAPAAVAAAPMPSAPIAAASAPIPRAVQAGGPLHRAWLRQGNGAPVVLVHGFGADLNGWRPLLAGLSLDRPVLAVDLPGHGASPLSGAPTLDLLADAVADTIAAEGLASVDLVGHSLGAAVATAVAERVAAEVRSLLLLSPAGLGPEINGAFLSGFSRATGEASLTPWMRLLFADEAQIAPAFVKARLKQRAEPATAANEEQVIAALFPESTQAFSVRAALARLAMPIRIVHGTADQIIPSRHVAGLPGTVAVHLFPGVGHMPQVEVKTEVGRLLNEHIRSAV
ncbi:acetoin dehydrogenase dihydrolipoyllysine-residue acetyltransferase subunit [Segnochrobactrum spirostomi]|uniref:Acetoin dehydrogenase dihydrolipoyllysine-residue acetyltransferase subunit n=1 Tax=Segnochrobactrum spirostomi TaxID=2608987 RepID=A0A6A7Y608_9HYPH|nr:acetoin dehydrogenase dihydrolipoyllysine-residue acetyltransferase subunit [Segnochrobactrum spirostomi]MQT14216.1 acetoin dehydrogenase dihydrolipoyllysine-residue acetyltransferase subunit [Segnochrobactrum spirostomi]